MKLYPAEFRYYKQALGCKPFQISLLYLRDKMNKASKKIALELWISWFCVLLYLAQMNEEEYFIHLESNAVWLARECYIWTGFHFSVDSNYAVALALHCFACWLAQKVCRPFFSTNQVKSKLIGTCSSAFCRAQRRLHVFASEFWLVYVIDCDMFCDWPKYLLWFWFCET